MALVVVALVFFAHFASGSLFDDAAFSLSAPDGTAFREEYYFHEDAKGWLKFHYIPATWSEARFACFIEGTQLVSPVDEGLMTIMEKLVKKANKTVHTGVHSLSSTEDYSTLDGIPLNKLHIKWVEGQPDNKNNNERCLALTPFGMDDIECQNVQPYFCYKKKVDHEVFEKNECNTFAKGYVLDERTKSCYKFYSNLATWYRAHTICNAEGGHLAIANSQKEAYIFADMAINASLSHSLYSQNNKEDVLDVHVGFYQWPNSLNSWPDRKAVFYTTLNGQTLEEAGYAEFAPNMNMHLVSPESCGTIQLKKTEFKGLSTIYCYESRPFICEIELPKVSE